LNPIEQLWAISKGMLKRQRLMTEENLSSRIAEACNDILVSNLYVFSNRSIKWYKKYHSKHILFNKI
jgi:hypothetical protein